MEGSRSAVGGVEDWLVGPPSLFRTVGTESHGEGACPLQPEGLDSDLNGLVKAKSACSELLVAISFVVLKVVWGERKHIAGAIPPPKKEKEKKNCYVSTNESAGL